MKTVCKKLLCLMLVAMMLVSAVPFAFATEGEVATADYWIEIRVNGEGKASQLFTMPVEPTEDDVIAYAMADEVFGAYFADYTDYAVELGVIGAAINFTGATEPPATEPPATEPPATEAPVTTYILEFYYLDEEGNLVGMEAEVENNEKIPFPNVPDVDRKDFLHWVDGKNNPVDKDTIWNVGESQKFTAIYKNDTTADDLVTLDVRVVYYVGNQWHHEAKLYTKSFELSKKNTMFEWLYSDSGKKQTRDALEAKGYYGYDWDQIKYYDYFNKGDLIKADQKADGDKTVCIKVYSTNEIEANVMLYVHTKETANVDRVIPMPGYTAGDFVTYADVKDAVKTKYSGSNMTISDLYTKTQWEDLLDDIKSSGSRSIEVMDNDGVTEIHVIVKNATSGSNADSSNPKTGDSIAVAATTMVLAAAALVSVLELKKRKMI